MKTNPPCECERQHGPLLRGKITSVTWAGQSAYVKRKNMIEKKQYDLVYDFVKSLAVDIETEVWLIEFLTSE